MAQSAVLTAAAWVTVVAAAVACGERGTPIEPPRAPSALPASTEPVAQATLAQTTPGETADHEAGRAIYNFRCYFCHGYSGDAKTLAATYLDPPPRSFQAATSNELPRTRIAAAVRDGREGTAMKSFRAVLSDADMARVAAFVEREFVQQKAPNTRYHTEANGWPDHERFAPAFDFAQGRIALDAPVESLDERQRAGRRLYVNSCITCHDRARVVDQGPAWSSRPVSYPRMGFVPGQASTPPVDAVSSASVYAKHDIAPRLTALTPTQRRGEALFQANCAFCHAADGTGKNWIGQFMEPKARDLTQFDAQSMPRARLHQTILEGLPQTSMPAWRHVLAPHEIDAITDYVMRAFVRPLPAGTRASR